MAADRDTRMELGIRISNWLWSAGVAVTALFVLLLATGAIHGRDRIRLEQLVFAAWTLGPPCWLVLQNRLWPPSSGSYERFHMHQSLLTTVWAGIAAFIAAIMFGRWG